MKLITTTKNTAIENLSISVEQFLYSEVIKTVGRAKDTSEIFKTNDNLSKSSTLASECRLVTFDIINILVAWQDQFLSAACIIEVLIFRNV